MLFLAVVMYFVFLPEIKIKSIAGIIHNCYLNFQSNVSDMNTPEIYYIHNATALGAHAFFLALPNGRLGVSLF
jgi:hypothetical protein